MRKLILLLLLAASVAAGGPARAAPGAVVLAQNFTFVPGQSGSALTLQITRGFDLEFANAEIFLAPHSVTSDRTNASGVALFDSGIKSAGGQGLVAGVAALAPGSYGFHCTVHFLTMKGTLVVTS
jgi:plastocyanin